MKPISIPNPYEKCITKYVKKREIKLISKYLFFEIDLKENIKFNVKYKTRTISNKLFSKLKNFRTMKDKRDKTKTAGTICLIEEIEPLFCITFTL